MLEIFAITAPIFLLIGIGYLAMLLRIANRERVQGVATFVLYIALPALVIRALTQSPIEEVFNLPYLLAYGGGSIAVFLLVLLIALRLQRRPLEVAALQALGTSASNSGFVGYPVAAMALGSPAAIFLALNMVVENLLVIPAALILAEVGRQGGQGVREVVRSTAMRLVRNPVLIGLTIGVSLALGGIELPAPVDTAIDMLADAAAPTALFVIGATLFGLRVRGMVGDVGQIVVGKLLLHPLAVLVAFLLLPGFDPLLVAGALIFACAPMISIYPLLGLRHGMEGVTAAALMVATLASFLTLSLVIWSLQGVGLLAAG